MANVPGLHVGGTGTSAVQSQGAVPVVASGGKAFAFSAVGTSGYFLRSGGTAIPTWHNLFGTTNTMVRQHFTAVSGLALRLYHDGISSFACMDFVSLVGGGSSGYFGYAVNSSFHAFWQNALPGGDIIIRTDGGNIQLGNTPTFAPGAGVSGIGMIAIQNCQNTPIGNPVGGGFLYSDAGKLKWWAPGGRVTEIAGNS